MKGARPVLFWKPSTPNGYMSNWEISPFTTNTYKVDVNGDRINGDGAETLTYNCVEQYIMHSKALLFGDAAVALKVMGTASPKQQKHLGRQVGGFVEEVWLRHRRPILYHACLCKFQQHDAMRTQLLDTGVKPLAEASPVDRIYGIGLSPTDARALDRTQWRGLNLLGDVLMDVRDTLRQ
eukprot:TRINITY_DN6720_c0_g1_i2.p1 TRINITY_DN6720_c0_g1~~TRINITY_DN6720_c0_g1_i2.p1  ORF type:complete len:180 (+),score=32.74 TRINITY_DN6720_c0_g1_i2:176-715(+)